jgi:Cysteine-rich CPXCG
MGAGNIPAGRAPAADDEEGGVIGDDDLDEEFPLGDGTADTGAVVRCPYCGEASEITLDPGGGASQEYVEDCPVCCRPWTVYVSYEPDGAAEVSLAVEDES